MNQTGVDMYDCAIIGAGAAGLSAALTLKATNKNFIWLGNRSFSNKVGSAHEIRNYPGLPFVTGKQMKEIFLKQAEDSGIAITQETVTGVYDMGDHFGILCGRQSYEAKTVILATGVESVKQIKGENEFLGKGVSYCAVCDGFLYKGKTIAVVCTAKSLEHEAEFLCSVAQKVYFIANYQGAALKTPNAETIAGYPLEIAGGNKAEKLIFKDGEIEVDGVFLLKEAVAPSALVAGLETDGAHVRVNRDLSTNIKGLFAAGDCTGRPYQYTKAVGEGNVAAHSVNAYLAENK